MRRVLLVVGAVVLLMAAANALFWGVVRDGDPTTGPGPWQRGDGDGPGGLWVLPTLLLLAGGYALYRAVRRSAGAVGDVMEAADRVAAGDLAVRVHPRGPAEVAQLAVSFNQMADRLAAHDARRRALLADVAHELRTPLAVVRGRVEGLLDGVYPRDDAQLEPLLDAVAVMTRLLEDLATLSTAEAGQLRLHREPTAPAALAADALAAFRPAADAKGVALRARVDPALPPVDVDPVRIAQVLDNLLANALRWTPPGGTVTLHADPSFPPSPRGRGVGGEGRPAASAGGEGSGIVLAVSDTGPGIPPDQLPSVFDRYAKSADSGGSGLGLAIARRLVEAHGGDIWADSRPGAGTTIALRLPT